MKKGFAMLLCVVLVLALAVPAGAEGQGAYLYSLVSYQDASVSLVSIPMAEEAMTVLVNGEPFSGYGVTTALEAGLPVTYYCMVDQSTSLSQKQREQQLRGITTLSSTMRPQDSMILVTMGDSLSFSKPLTDPEKRQAEVEAACVYNSYSTALYQNIMDTIDAAQSCGSLCCIVLFTDGLDNIRSQSTLQETEQRIREAGISLNTLCLGMPTQDPGLLANVERMKSFAEESMGGIGTAPGVDNPDSPTNVETAVADIMLQILSSNVISLNAAQLPRTGALTVSLSVDGLEGTDNVTLNPDLLPDLPAPTQPETTAPTVPETTQPSLPTATLPAPTQPAPAGKPQASTAKLVYLLVLLVLVAGSAIAGLVALRRRTARLAPPAYDPDFPEEEILPTARTGLDMDIRLDFSQSVSIPTCIVRLESEDNPEKTVEFTIEANESVTLGRNDKSRVILNEADSSLSGKHFELQWDSRVMHLRDCGSTNGTVLNGVPLKPEQWIRVESGAIIRAGDSSYTLSIRR